MKVQCSVCQFEKEGFCTKKKNAGRPVKIELNKRRICDLYSEDPMRVLAQFRKKEKHNLGIKKNAFRRAQLIQALAKARKEGVKAFVEGSEQSVHSPSVEEEK